MFGDSSSSGSEEEQETRPRGCGVMDWHNGTEEAMFLYVERDLRKHAKSSKSSGGDLPAEQDLLVERILASVDAFCSRRHWMMHVGPQKAQFLLEAVQKVPPATAGRTLLFLEVGSYCGYSSVLLASELRRRDRENGNADAGDNTRSSCLVCLEPDEQAVRYTRRMAVLAGLQGYIKVLQTTAEDAQLPERLQEAAAGGAQGQGQGQGQRQVDLVFIDHDKSRYLADLLLLEKMRILPPPSARAAAPAAPPLAPAAAREDGEVRILCLHGHEQNSEVFRKRLGGLPRKMKAAQAKFVFLDGPVLVPARRAPSQAGAEVGTEAEDAPVLRSWWRRAREGLIDLDSLQETLQLVRDSWETEGPFAGILGFSMGGTMACQIVMHLPCPGLKFVVCAVCVACVRECV